MAKTRRKSMRRAYMKKWSSSMINTGSSIDRYTLRDLGYGERGRAPPTNNIEIDRLIELFFPPIPQEMLDTTNRLAWNMPRVLAVKKAMEKQLENLREITGVRHEHVIVLRNTRFEKTCMCWGMKGGHAMITYTHVAGIYKRSYLYPSREVAMERYKSNRVIWVESRTLDPETPPATV